MTGVWMSRKRVAMSVCLCTLILPAALPIVSASASSTSPLPLRVVGTSASASLASVVVAVPPELANQALPAAAFDMRQGGRSLPVTVRRVADAGLDVYVVLDTTAANPAVLAQQSAAADLLRQLPATVRTAVATSDTVPVPESGSDAALRKLAEVKPRSRMAVDKTLNRIAKAKVDHRRQLIVLLATCPKDSATDLSPLRAALDSGTSQLDTIGFRTACRSRLPSLARDSGGLALPAVAPNQLAEAVDTVAYDTLSQYQLSVPASAVVTPVVVTVDFAGFRAITEVRLPAAARGPAGHTSAPKSLAPAADTRANDSGGLRPIALLAVLAALILIAAGAATLRVMARLKPRRRPALAYGAVSDIGLAIVAAPGEFVASGEHVMAMAVAPAPEPARVAATTEAVLDERAVGVPAISPAATADSAPADRPTAADLEHFSGAPQPHITTLPASGMSDGTVWVRPPRPEDVGALHGFAETVGGLAGGWVTLPEPATWADCEALVDTWTRAWSGEPASGAGGDLGLVVERVSEGGMIGCVGLRVKPDAVEVRYGTAPQHRGQGYAKRALRLVTQWLAHQDQVRLVQAVIPPSDSVSRSVARDAGFVPSDIVQTFVPATGTVAVKLRFVFERRSPRPDRRAKDRRSGVATGSSRPDRRVKDRRGHVGGDRRRRT